MSSNRHSAFARHLKLGASMGAIAMLTMPGAALAQDNLETVVVTGTLIKGIAPVGANLITFDAKQIQATGAQNTTQILANIPQITTAFNTTVNDPTGATGGGFRPAIRNITQPGGGTTTLTLIDGHNMVGVGGLQTVPDPGYLPTIVIQRVDVLADGGSALYGANATSGIINFITRDSFEGLQANVAAGFASGYTSTNASFITGHNWSSGAAYLSYEYRNQSFMMQSVHPYYRQNLTDIGGADNRISTCPLPNITAAGVAYHLNGLPSDSAASFAANLAPGTVKCENWQNVSQIPKEEQNTFFGSVRQHIMDGVDFNMKFLWGARQTTSAGAQYVASQTINNTNPYFRQIAAETVQTINFDFAPGSNGVKSVNNTARDVLFNITPEFVFSNLFGDWEAKLMGNYSRSAHLGMSNTFNNVYLSNGLRQDTVNGGPTLTKTGYAANAIDPYNLALTNPATYQSMYLSGGTLGKSIGEQAQVRLAADGTLFTLPGGDVKASIGAMYGVDYYNGSWFNGPVGQMDPPAIAGGVYQISKKRRYVGSVFGEVVIPLVGVDNAMPLVQSFTVDISGRHDDYSDFGATDNPKFSFTWDVFDALTVRGNIGTSFNTPSLADVTAPDARFQLQTYTSPNTALPGSADAIDQLRPTILVPGGNPLLSPEKANTWSVGAEFHPHELFGADLTGLDISMTRWHIGEHNQVGLACYQGTTFPTCAAIPAYNRFYIYNPTLAQTLTAFDYKPGLPLLNFPAPSLASVFPANGASCKTINVAIGCTVVTPFVIYDARRNNLGNVQLEGVDFHASYMFDTSIGTLSGGLDGTYSLSNKYQGADGLPLTSRQTYSTPLYTASVYLGLTSGPLTSKLTMNYTPSYQLDPVQDNASRVYGQKRIGDFAPLNLYVGYDLDGLYDWTEGSTVGVTVNNMFDHDPPIKKTGGTTAYATSLGRFIELGLSKKF